MEIVKIDWLKTKLSDLPELQDTYLYAFTRGNNLLYLGMTYYQIVDDEIKQSLRRLSINNKGLTIWLGYINGQKSTYATITKQIIQDTEALLIICNETTFNIQSTETYSGRNNFKVVSSGLPYLRRCVRCENNKIYLSC